MEVYQKILTNILAQEEISIQFSNLSIDAAQIVEGICYQTINQIRADLEDDSLDDPECFARIEQIVCIFEKIGSDGGCRHDFG